MVSLFEERVNKKCANSNKKVLTNVLTRLNIVLTATMSVARKAGDKSDRG